MMRLMLGALATFAALPAQAETVVFSSRTTFDAYLVARGIQPTTQTFDNLPVIQLGMRLTPQNTYPTPFNEQGLSIGVLGALSPVEGKNEISDGQINVYLKDFRDFGVMLITRNLIGFDYAALKFGGLFVETDIADARESRVLGSTGFFGLYTDGPIGRVLLRGRTGESLTFDNVTFDATVPEPAIWMMMIGGFGILGATSRRKIAAQGCAAAA